MRFSPFLYLLLVSVILLGCGEGTPPNDTNEHPDATINASSEPSKGIGPIQEITLGEVDESLVAEGKKIYESKCTACHNVSSKLIGPPQAGILERRTPEWVMNMILNPSEMIKKDPTAMALLKEYNNVPMTEQGLSEEEARAILEYFRTI